MKRFFLMPVLLIPVFSYAMENSTLVKRSSYVPHTEDQLSPRNQSPRKEHPVFERARRYSTESPLFVSHENVKLIVSEKELSPRLQKIDQPFALNKREQKKAVVIQVLANSSGRKSSRGEDEK